MATAAAQTDPRAVVTAVRDWSETPEARAIIAAIDAEADLWRRAYTPIHGDRYWMWSAGEASEKLEEVRQREFQAVHGTYEDAWKAGRHVEYIKAHEAVLSVPDLLARKFGDPAKGYAAPSPTDWSPRPVRVTFGMGAVS